MGCSAPTFAASRAEAQLTAGGRSLLEHGFRLERRAVRAHDANRRCARRAASLRRGSSLAGDCTCARRSSGSARRLGRRPAAAAGPLVRVISTAGPSMPSAAFVLAGRSYGFVDAQVAADHAAVGDELLHHAADEVDGNREAEAFGHVLIAGRADDGRVDADELAARVDERAARVAGVDRGVRLDEVLERRDAELTAARRADDAHRHGLTQAQRVADREDDLADLERVRAAQRGSPADPAGRSSAARARCRDRCRRACGTATRPSASCTRISSAPRMT